MTSGTIRCPAGRATASGFISRPIGSSGMEENQVWKIPVEGGQPVQVTRLGGFSAYESLDGQTLYYAKTRQDNPEIWQVPVNGGNESRVSAILRPSTWANWALTESGILFLSADNRESPHPGILRVRHPRCATIGHAGKSLLLAFCFRRRQIRLVFRIDPGTGSPRFQHRTRIERLPPRETSACKLTAAILTANVLG